MPRYHFHSEDGVCLTDADGTELPDLWAAQDAAIQVLSESLHRNSKHFLQTGAFRVIVTDQRGLRLFVIQVTANEGADR